jgi:hypothetical protein
VFTVGSVSQSNVGFMCEVRLNSEIWALCFGRTREQAVRRAEIAARALNRDRAN